MRWLYSGNLESFKPTSWRINVQTLSRKNSSDLYVGFGLVISTGEGKKYQKNGSIFFIWLMLQNSSLVSLSR